jgi:hypothetical protein
MNNTMAMLYWQMEQLRCTFQSVVMRKRMDTRHRSYEHAGERLELIQAVNHRLLSSSERKAS